jgi:hypothetical protein
LPFSTEPMSCGRMLVGLGGLSHVG